MPFLTAILNPLKIKMKINYYPETDSLYINLTNKPSVDSQEIKPGIVLDFDEDQNLVGIDIDHASQLIDLKTIESQALPFATSIT